MFNFKVKTDNKVNKTFSYSRGGVNLSFTLRTDVKGELKDFLECLKVAIQEVEEEVNTKI